MAKASKSVAKKTAKKVAPKHTVKSVAESIASLSHEDRVKLHGGFSTLVQQDNETVSVGKTPDGTNYQQWINTIE